MRLDVDLGFDAVPGRTLGPGDAMALDLHSLAGMLRTPRRLSSALRTRQFEELRVREGPLPPSAVQAAVLLSLVLARTDTWVLGGRRLTRAAFALRALATAARAGPGELVHSLAL